MAIIRRAKAADLDAIAAIQAASPQAAHWPVADYLQYECWVAESTDGAIAGFLTWRPLDDVECEVLNLAVAPAFRRQGVGRELLNSLLNLRDRQIFLEVRESNHTARIFYNSMGFKEVSIRPKYYDEPVEGGIVMKFHSC